jgi:hypothetical protein
VLPKAEVVMILRRVFSIAIDCASKTKEF